MSAATTRCWPRSPATGCRSACVADDSSFPELFELLRAAARAAWGVTVIPWRNLREIYGVLRRREMLGLLVDWGYRPDGIPVRLFDAWTTLPAGPATLAAKTGSLILPVTIRRQPDGSFKRVVGGARSRCTSSDPAAIQRATQAIADALEATIGAAPGAVVQLQADLAGDRRGERRARATGQRSMQAGRPDPGPGAPVDAGTPG